MPLAFSERYAMYEYWLGHNAITIYPNAMPAQRSVHHGWGLTPDRSSLAGSHKPPQYCRSHFSMHLEWKDPTGCSDPPPGPSSLASLHVRSSITHSTGCLSLE